MTVLYRRSITISKSNVGRETVRHRNTVVFPRQQRDGMTEGPHVTCDGPASRTYSHSAAFIDDTLAFHARILSSPDIAEQQLPTQFLHDSINMTSSCFTELACDTEKLELYVFDSCSRRWFVCDARGFVNALLA
jgi:hypothetical protein